MSRPKPAMKSAKKRLSKPAGELMPIDLSAAVNVPAGVTRAYKNNRYIILVYDNKETLFLNQVAIQTPLVFVQRVDDKPIPNHWYELQQIKNKIFGNDAQAIEYYPPESELVDQANIYWLWIIPGLILSPIEVS